MGCMGESGQDNERDSQIGLRIKRETGDFAQKKCEGKSEGKAVTINEETARSYYARMK